MNQCLRRPSARCAARYCPALAGPRLAPVWAAVNAPVGRSSNSTSRIDRPPHQLEAVARPDGHFLLGAIPGPGGKPASPPHRFDQYEVERRSGCGCPEAVQDHQIVGCQWSPGACSLRGRTAGGMLPQSTRFGKNLVRRLAVRAQCGRNQSHESERRNWLSESQLKCHPNLSPTPRS